MFNFCPVCLTKLEYGIGNYYSQKCDSCNCVVDVYHYGYDVFIDDKQFHFDESGYGNDENQKAMNEYLKAKARPPLGLKPQDITIFEG
jgi:hypothetical protein